MKQKERWYRMVMIEKTKLLLILHLTGALIQYRFVVGKITGNSRIIFTMSLKAPYNMTRIKTRLWLGTIFLCLHFGLAYQTGLCSPPVSVHCCTKRPPSVYCFWRKKSQYRECVVPVLQLVMFDSGALRVRIATCRSSKLMLVGKLYNRFKRWPNL